MAQHVDETGSAFAQQIASGRDSDQGRFIGEHLYAGPLLSTAPLSLVSSAGITSSSADDDQHPPPTRVTARGNNNNKYSSAPGVPVADPTGKQSSYSSKRFANDLSSSTPHPHLLTEASISIPSTSATVSAAAQHHPHGHARLRSGHGTRTLRNRNRAKAEDDVGRTTLCLGDIEQQQHHPSRQTGFSSTSISWTTNHAFETPSSRWRAKHTFAPADVDTYSPLRTSSPANGIGERNFLNTTRSSSSSSSRLSPTPRQPLAKSLPARQGSDMHPVSPAPSSNAFHYIDNANVNRNQQNYPSAADDRSSFGFDPTTTQHLVNNAQSSQVASGSVQQQQQHLTAGTSTGGFYDYRSHPSSPQFFPSHSPSPLIGQGGGRTLQDPFDLDSDYLLSQYLGGGELRRSSSATSFNGSSYENGSSYSYGLGGGSDFGDDVDFSAFGLNINEGEASGDQSYAPSDYGGDGPFDQSAGGLADFAFQQPGSSSGEKLHFDSGHQRIQTQDQQQGDREGGENMPYRDLMGGPGSLLLPAETTASHHATVSSSQGMGMVGFVDQPTSRQHQAHYYDGIAQDQGQNVIFAEPSSLSGSLSGGFPTGNRQQFEAPQAPASGARPSHIAPHVFDANGPSEFARRMNSEASEMSFSNDSEASTRQNSLAHKTSLTFSQHASYAQTPNMAQGLATSRHSMESPAPTASRGFADHKRPSSQMGFPYPQFPGVAPNNGKPQSPPQLIIPDSPLPSSAATQASQQNQQQAPPSQPALNTLLPPANPHLLHGAGFGGISPVGPGGPSINIVPSTPTSALKDNVRGIWERMASQASHAMGSSQNQAHATGNKLQEDAFLASVPMGEGRRASHTGVFGETAELNFETLLQQSTISHDAGERPVPETAPAVHSAFNFAPPPTNLRAPGNAQRQRSRSESYMTGMLPNFDLALSQEQFKMMMGITDDQMGGFHQMAGMGLGNGMEMSDSAVASVSGSPSSIDPKVLNPMDVNHSNHSSPYVGPMDNTAHVQFESTMTTGPYKHMLASSAPPWQTSHVMAGPEVYGANFIVTNDGRRIPFDLSYKGGGIIPNQAESSIRSSIAHSDVSSDGGNTSDVAMYDGSSSSPGRLRHRRAVQSEDMGRPVRWASAEGNQTAHFLNTIVNPTDGSLLPPNDKMVTHPRQTSISHNRRASSPYARDRSASVVSSTSSAAASPSPELAPAKTIRKPNQQPYGDLAPPGRPPKAVRAKVTTPATEVASKGRRTHDGQFICPVPGCGSTFTRHFNLKGHLRSHNEERPFKCTFEGCSKSFARQHDCKRHMQLHVGLKPFVCEGCQRTFARLDALSRHHKTEAGLECAISHPLPTNPDGSLLSESKYRAEMARRAKSKQEGVVM